MEDPKQGPKDAIESPFRDGVAEPDDPNEFMLKTLGKTKDDSYESYPEDQIPPGENLDSLRAKLPKRREKMKSTLLKISEISRHMVNTYRTICERNGMDPGRISVYIVGGRVREKPLQHSSDIDVVFTTENASEGLQPNYSLKDNESPEVMQKKIAARKQFVDVLEKGFRDLDLLEKGADGEETGWFIEPKGYGDSDVAVRKEWSAAAANAPGKDAQIAVLVFKG